MERQHIRLLNFGILVFCLSIACGLSSPQLIAEVPGVPETLAAATWSVMQTSAALSATPTSIPPLATATPTVTPTPTITLTPTPTNTQVPPLTAQPTKTPMPTSTPTFVPTSTYIYYYPGGGSSGGGGSGGGGSGGGGGGKPPVCLNAALVQSVTIPNGTILPTNTPFTKIWQIKNTGACVWNNKIALVFKSGSKMSGAIAIIPGDVRPGQKINMGVDMVSPSTEGDYSGSWILETNTGIQFGDTYSVKITVNNNPHGVIFDFGHSYCTANWQSSSKSLPCPGNYGSSSGFEVLVSQPYLESGKQTSPALWTQPPFKANGVIEGIYPALPIQAGERFQATVGCMHGFPNCKVTFSLFYKTGSSGTNQLGTDWQEIYDGATTSIDLDLSFLAGENVSFIFKVKGTGQPNQNAGFWFQPQLYMP